MEILHSKKYYESTAFYSSNADKKKVFEPDIRFINFFLATANPGECFGVSFREFITSEDFSGQNPLDILKNIFSSPEIQSITGYTTIENIQNKINLENIILINDLVAEFTDLIYTSNFYFSKPKEECKIVSEQFIKKYFDNFSLVIKGNFPWNNWFANDGIDFFYLIIKNKKIWILNFYISD